MISQTQSISDYIQRKDWTLEDYLAHDAGTVSAFRVRFGEACFLRRIFAWRERQAAPSGYKPSGEEFIADLAESLAG